MQNPFFFLKNPHVTKWTRSIITCQKPTQILKLGSVCCHLDEWRIICLPFFVFKRLFHAFHQILFTIFFSFFLELYHWSLFGLNNAWHVVFDMKEVRIFRLLLIKNWSILRTTELSSNYLLSFDDAVTVSIYKSNYKTFLCSFLCLKLRPHHCHDYEIQLIFPSNGKCANSINLPTTKTDSSTNGLLWKY